MGQIQTEQTALNGSSMHSFAEASNATEPNSNEELAVIELSALRFSLIEKNCLKKYLNGQEPLVNGKDLYRLIIGSDYRRMDLEHLLPPSSRVDRTYAVIEINKLIKQYEKLGLSKELMENCHCFHPELLPFLRMEEVS